MFCYSDNISIQRIYLAECKSIKEAHYVTYLDICCYNYIILHSKIRIKCIAAYTIHILLKTIFIQLLFKRYLLHIILNIFIIISYVCIINTFEKKINSQKFCNLLCKIFVINYSCNVVCFIYITL